MKYIRNIDYWQVQENLKTHEYTSFLHMTPWETILQKKRFYEFCSTNNYSTKTYF